MYFEKFPLTTYSMDQGQSIQVITDIVRRATFNDFIKNNFVLFDEYDIVDGEKPEIVSHNLYGSVEYYWVILLLNDIIDPRYDWCLSSGDLLEYVSTKYGSSEANIFGTHHYEASSTNPLIVDSTYPGRVSITNYEHENSENEKKRRIRVVKSEYLSAIVDEFRKIIKNG